MGYITAEIVKVDNDFVWKGEKNLLIYEKFFEYYLIKKFKQEYSIKSQKWLENLNCLEYL